MAVTKNEIKQMIGEEIAVGGYPFPQELVESIVKVESNYKAGVVNKKSGASGLTQIMPITLEEYNKHNFPQVLLSELRQDSIPAARKQIQVGLWILGRFWKGAYNYLQPRLGTVPIDQIVKIADLFYVAGPNATKKKLAQVSTPTYETLLTVFPNWNAHPHVHKVWAYTSERNPTWDLEAIDQWVGGSDNEPKIAGFGGHLGAFVLASILIAFAWNFLGRKNNGE